MGPTLQGAGLGWRAALGPELLRARRAVDLIEVVAEACFAQPGAWREARALSAIWPVIPHGVKLSLGSAEGIDEERARRLGALARDLRAPAVSEHVAFVRAGGREIGHLTALPYTRDAVRAVARNVARARRRLPEIPLLLENVAWSLRWPEDAMGEGDFYTAVVEATGCDLLLDLGNLYANARNAGADPEAWLEAHPLERVAMVHLAGGVVEHGFYFDTHAHPTPDAVFALLARVVRRAGAVPVIVERDDGFPPFAVLAEEVARARAIVGRAAVRAGGGAGAGPGPGAGAGAAAGAGAGGARAAADSGEEAQARRALAARQEALARRLVPDPDDAAGGPGGRDEGFDAEEVARTRRVLDEKRIDDALPLLPRLCTAARERVGELARGCVQAMPRPIRHAAQHDALRIAARAADEALLAGPARLDGLVLQAQWLSASDGGIRPRRAPFVGRAALGPHTAWVVKGPGARAPVRVFEMPRPAARRGLAPEMGERAASSGAPGASPRNGERAASSGAPGASPRNGERAASSGAPGASPRR